MPKLLDPSQNPILDRLHGYGNKHRLRSKHYQPITDFPDDATFSVLDESRLSEVDFFTNTDELFVVSEPLRDLITELHPGTISHRVEAKGVSVFVIEPVTDATVMFEADSFSHSVSGYAIVEASNLRASTESDAPFTPLMNSGVYVISQALIERAADAGIVWNTVDQIESFVPYPHHPYAIISPNYASGSVKNYSAEWSEVEGVPHPLGAFILPSSIFSLFGPVEPKPDEGWLSELNDESACLAPRYASGLTIPELTATVPDVAKSKRKKAWKTTKNASGLSIGVPTVSGAIREKMEELSLPVTFSQVDVVEPELDERETFWIVHPNHVVEWIDWEKSDVKFRSDCEVDGYADLVSTSDSFDSTEPIVRIAGTALVLIHDSIRSVFEEGFRLVPLNHRRVSRNLDDYLRA